MERAGGRASHQVVSIQAPRFVQHSIGMNHDLRQQSIGHRLPATQLLVTRHEKDWIVMVP